MHMHGGGDSSIATSYTLGRPLPGCPCDIPDISTFPLLGWNHVHSAPIYFWAQQLGLFCLAREHNPFGLELYPPFLGQNHLDLVWDNFPGKKYLDLV